MNAVARMEVVNIFAGTLLAPTDVVADQVIPLAMIKLDAQVSLLLIS